jgi:hypothetical protein
VDPGRKLCSDPGGRDNQGGVDRTSIAGQAVDAPLRSRPAPDKEGKQTLRRLEILQKKHRFSHTNPPADRSSGRGIPLRRADEASERPDIPPAVRYDAFEGQAWRAAGGGRKFECAPEP